MKISETILPFSCCPLVFSLICDSKIWRVAKGSSISWVAKFKGDICSEIYCKLPKRWSRSHTTAGFLYRAGAETPLNFWEKFRVSPRNILDNVSAVDTQTAVLVSTAEVWSTGYPNTYFSGFSGYPQLTLDFLPGDEHFRIFS